MHQQAISNSKRRPVILVGLGSDPKAIALVEELRMRGLDLVEADRADSVPDLLRKTPRSAIVVYNPVATRDAHQVLAAIESAQRQAPVVVLVDESDFGDYYALMRLGALEYFEMSERPELIARGIEWAAESLAS
jgi:DNA-binding NtrC family response regulator